METAAHDSAFILSMSCEIPPRSKPEIVGWFLEAAKEYGRAMTDSRGGKLAF